MAASTRSTAAHRVFMLAGEASGDVLAGRLMRALPSAVSKPLEFVGVGGEAMEGAGLHQPLFPLSELSVMGFTELLPHVWRLRQRLLQAVSSAAALKPHVITTVDSKGFNFRFLSRLHEAMGDDYPPALHYVAPSVWAYRKRKTPQLRPHVDELLMLLPFEPEYFADQAGLRTTFVGHPAVEAALDYADSTAGSFRLFEAERPSPATAAYRIERGIPPEAPVLAVLPGSRPAELVRSLPVMRGALARLADELPGLHVIAPTVSPVAAELKARVAADDWPVETIVEDDSTRKMAAFAAADVALAVSGTVVTELALARLPTAVIYDAPWLTAVLARRLVALRYASIPNIMADAPLLPELLFEACTVDGVASCVSDLLASAPRRQEQVEALQPVLRQLVRWQDGVPVRPSTIAAQRVAFAVEGGSDR
eukprot:PLAT12791.1.p1 GENE.PLAT12791.1~~PLAT12791.1.p1  ORF type:complete len:424 (+),score=160.87 PLAT12791.1:32-1303(+)